MTEESKLPSIMLSCGRKITTNSSYTDVDFRHSVYDATRLKGCTFNTCTFNKNSFVSSYLEKLTFIGGTIINCDFRGSHINNITFRNVDLSYTNFSSSIMENIVFENCRLTSCKFLLCVLKSLHFEGGDDYEDVDFSSSTLSNITTNSFDINKTKRFNCLNL